MCFICLSVTTFLMSANLLATYLLLKKQAKKPIVICPSSFESAIKSIASELESLQRSHREILSEKEHGNKLVSLCAGEIDRAKKDFITATDDLKDFIHELQLRLENQTDINAGIGETIHFEIPQISSSTALIKSNIRAGLDPYAVISEELTHSQ